MHSAASVQIVHPQVVSNVNHWDRDGLTIPRQFRDRFGPGVKLTFHVEQGRTQGRQPYWWEAWQP